MKNPINVSVNSSIGGVLWFFGFLFTIGAYSSGLFHNMMVGMSDFAKFTALVVWPMLWGQYIGKILLR